MADLTAIDILVNPDDRTIERAKAVNARLRKSVPGGFALDATHQPHITMLQRYVRTADLDQVFAAIEKATAATDTGTLTFEAVQIRHADWGVPGQGYAVFLVKPGVQVQDYQARLLSAITPFTEPGGTAAAYVTDADDPGISQSTLSWVEQYAPGQIGANYTRTCRSASQHSTTSRSSKLSRSTPSRSIRPASPSTTSATTAPPGKNSNPGKCENRPP